MLPYYLSIGMTAAEFWNDDPWLAAAYRKADEFRRQKCSEEMWLQGLYIYNAFNVVIGNALRKKGTPAEKYLEEPIRVTPLSEQEKEEKAEKERRKTIEYFNRLAKKFESCGA